MHKTTRLAACDPCRHMKLACDHAKPSCARCVRLGRSNACTYRDRPFKKRRLQNGHEVMEPLIDESEPVPDTELLEHESTSSTRQPESPCVDYRYPNPGFLGFSSHATIFSRLPTDTDIQEQSPGRAVRTPSGTVSNGATDNASSQQVSVLKDLLSVGDIEALCSFISFWLAKGINLAVGGPLVPHCLQTFRQMVTGSLFDTTDEAFLAKILSRNSARAIVTPSTSSFSSFCKAFCDSNVRWETLALALVAIGRATTDITFFPPLYTNRDQLRSFQQLVTNLSDRCLEIALSVDCMNDIQLVCQYENWILHSVVDGDQSFNSWRRLGDVISSLLYLGYHEEIKSDCAIPSFLIELRKTAFAMIYSDDKNIAVFLGRPPRLNRSFCHFQLPSGCYEEIGTINNSPESESNESHPISGSNEKISYITGIRWTAFCARLKEEILEVFQKRDQDLDVRSYKLAAIHTRAINLWSTLPNHLQLQGSLSSHKDRTPFEKDFLLSVRLTYLQVLFLLANGRFIDNNDEMANGDVNLFDVCQEMLSLVVEAIVLRDQLVNSGTSLIWKAAHYGLPAAGMICLSILHPPFRPEVTSRLQMSKIIQDLSVFVGEIQMGGLIQPGEPNYSLLHRATCTMSSLLKATLCLEGVTEGQRGIRDLQVGANQNGIEHSAEVDPLNQLLPTDLWGCEYDFWQSLGAHPLLSTSQMNLGGIG